MLKRDYAGQEECSVARTLEIIGDRWTWLIIRLVDEGIFERVSYSERPPRYEYRLTRKGSDLFTALNALRQWGDRYLCAKPMRLLRVKGSETTVVAALVPEGTPALSNEDIELVPGPGFPRT